MKTLYFSNDDPLHCIGLGTWKATGEEVKNAVITALDAGYRHFDTAAIYRNEVEIGEALKVAFENGIVERRDVFITSKLWNDAHEGASVIPALKESLEKLQLDYLDLYLIHWPVATQKGVDIPDKPTDYIPLEQLPIIETWNQLEKAKELGLASHIGVSNFSKEKLQDLVSKATIKPEMNQIELHPLLQQKDLLNFCKSEEIHITGYSPLGSRDRSESMKAEGEPDLLNLNVIKEIAAKHQITPAQVLLAWQCEKGISAIPKSTSTKHLKLNFEAGSISLDVDDMNNIASLDRQFRYINGKFFETPGSGYSNIFDD